MYLRVSKVRRGQRIYEYAQLVESFRREDGTPTNRVLANLGQLDQVAVGNLRAALEASREGKVLALSPEVASMLARPTVEANLRYLDVAVLLRLWSQLHFADVLATCLPERDRTVPSADVVTALVLQRCVAPGSKLAAERWYPTTALPELQGVEHGRFNNSRVHRVLEDLEAAEGEIQVAIAPTVKADKGAFGALFIDATDTWFVGEGPPLAQKGRDKEGVYRRRVGIVMLCDQDGWPLRWKTLNGRFHDGTSLLEMASEVAALPWTKDVPVVLDRAAGHAGATEILHARGLKYVTALPDPELESSGVPIPWAVLDALQLENATSVLQHRLEEAGFRADGRGRWIKDLGTFDKAHSARVGRLTIAAAAMKIVDAIESGGPLTGVSVRHVARHKRLRALVPEVRDRLRDEEAGWLTFTDLVQIANRPPAEQPIALESALAAPRGQRQTARRGDQRSGYPARAVLSVSPERLLADRRADEDHVAAVEAVVADVNRRLSHGSNRRTDGSALAEIEISARKYALGAVLRARITGTGSERRVVLERDEDAWRRRRRGDGINIIISHPGVVVGAPDLVALYFSKDAIERDFRIIKSVVELRPVHHRTDIKVRAHVTICMLALLLLRGFERSLGASGISTSAALERMEPVRLNVVAQGTTPFYTVTRPDTRIRELLETIGMSELLDDLRVARGLRPR